MTIWFLLLLGLATYLMVQRVVAHSTKTPVWLLWLVLMTPAFLLTAWTLRYGTKQPPPPSLILWLRDKTTSATITNSLVINNLYSVILAVISMGKAIANR